jgi:hypothetical protein
LVMKRKITIFGMLAVLFTSQACRDKCSEGERGNPYIRLPMLVTPADTAIRLGDTLTINVTVPFDNINTRDGGRTDISNSTMSMFGIDYRIINMATDGKLIVDGLDQIKVIYEKGGGVKTSEVRMRQNVTKGASAFEMVAKVIPLKRGLVNLAVYRAEGEMEKGCVLVDFTPVCANDKKNLELYTNLFSGPPDPGYASLYSNHFYIWVR